MSFANLQTVEELLPFSTNVERKAIPELIGFLNHCLSVAPQWTAKDTDLVKARQLLVGPTMAIAARSAIEYAKGFCPRIEAWVKILAQHDNWIIDPRAPLDLTVFKPQESPVPNEDIDPHRRMETESLDGGGNLERSKQEGEGKGKGRGLLSGEEPMNLDLPEHEDLGGKKRRTPMVSDDEMEPLEGEAGAKRQKTDLQTFRCVGGAAGPEPGQEGDQPGKATKSSAKAANGKGRVQVKKQQPAKLEMPKSYDPPCQTCQRRKVDCLTMHENQACTQCAKSKLKCRYAKGGAGDGEEEEAEVEAEEPKRKSKTKQSTHKSDNQPAKGQAGPSKPPAKRPPKAKRQSTAGNASSDSYNESESDDGAEKKPKADKDRGKVQVKKQASGDTNRKALSKHNGAGQQSASKGSGKTKNSGGNNERQGGRQVDPGTRRELIAGNIEDAVATFIERAVFHEMTLAELRGELSGVRRELDGVVSELSDLYDRDEHTQDAMKELQEDVEGLDGRFQNLDIRPFVKESERSIQTQITAASKKQMLEVKQVEESVSTLLKRVESLEERGKAASKGGSYLTQSQVEKIIDLKIAGLTKDAGDGMVVDPKVVDAIINQKLAWFKPEVMEDVVQKRVKEIFEGGTKDLLERLTSLEEQMAGGDGSKELAERLGVFEARLGNMGTREETSGGSELANSLKAMEELIRVQTESVRLQIGQLKSEMGQTLEAHGQEVRSEVQTHLHSIHAMMLQQTQAQAELYKNFSGVLEAVRRFKGIIQSSPQREIAGSRHSRHISLSNIFDGATDGPGGGMVLGGGNASRIVEAVEIVEAVDDMLRRDAPSSSNAPGLSGSTSGSTPAPMSGPVNSLKTSALGRESASMTAERNDGYMVPPVVSLGHLMPRRQSQEGSSTSSATLRPVADPGRLFSLRMPASTGEEGSAVRGTGISTALKAAPSSTPSFPSPGASASGITRPTLSNVSTPREHRSPLGSPLTGLTSDLSTHASPRTSPPPETHLSPEAAEEGPAEAEMVPRRTRATTRREARGH